MKVKLNVEDLIGRKVIDVRTLDDGYHVIVFDNGTMLSVHWGAGYDITVDEEVAKSVNP